jgi:hypothetical protein
MLRYIFTPLAAVVLLTACLIPDDAEARRGGGNYGAYDEEAYEPVAGQGDPIAECARRFKTYDPVSQTYIVRRGVRASCP